MTKGIENKVRKTVNNMLITSEQLCYSALSLTWIHNEKQYATDSYRIIEINDPISDLPQNDGKYDNSSISNELEGLRNMIIYGNMEEIEYPSVKEVRDGIKDAQKNKRNKKVLMCLYDDVIVNAKYFLELLEALGSTNVKIYISNGKKKYREPLYMESEIGSAMLLPVNGYKRDCRYWCID